MEIKTSKEWFDLGMEKLKSFNGAQLIPALQYANDGAKEDVQNINGCAYYQWTTCLVEVMKPKQIVELGGAMGVWDICVLHSLPADSRLYSITLAEHGLEFSYIRTNYTNFIPIVGDDLDMNNWKGIDLSKTDLWFIDSLHTKDHLEKELKLYSPFFKKGAVVLFDDIRMEELWPVWEKLPYDKFEATDPCHYTGYGIAIL